MARSSPLLVCAVAVVGALTACQASLRCIVAFAGLRGADLGPEAWRPRGGRARSHDQSLLRRRASDSSSLPELWKAGPAEIYTGPAQKAMYLMKENPDLFEATVEQELEVLAKQKDEQEVQQDALEETDKKDTLVLRQRMQEVREAERARIATELLYLMVCHKFQKLKVPLISPMKDGGTVQLGMVDLKGLTTDIYTKDALELVKEHLFSVIGPEAGPAMMGGPVMMQIALYQASQVYAMSVFFGYYLRRMDARYQLEKLAGSLGAFGDGDAVEPEEPPPASLKDYVSGFGPEEMIKLTSVASHEAQAAMQRQVMALFGDIRTLRQKLQDALGPVLSQEEGQQKVQAAIQSGEIESIRISGEDIRRMILEAVAFGSLLNDSEKQAESLYELTPKELWRGSLTGDPDADGRLLGE